MQNEYDMQMANCLINEQIFYGNVKNGFHFQ